MDNIRINFGGLEKIEERFMVGRETGNPKSYGYTSTLWNLGLCYPPKFYFHSVPLKVGVKENVSLPGGLAILEVGNEASHLGYRCYEGKITSVLEESDLWVCKEIPLLARYQGKSCFLGKDFTGILTAYEEG